MKHAGARSGSVAIDAAPLALTVALVLRDAAELPIRTGTPPRVDLPVSELGLRPDVTEDDWSQWWTRLVGDVQSDRPRFPESGASTSLKPHIAAALTAYGPWQERLRPPGDPRLDGLRRAADSVMTSEHPLTHDLHVEVLPVGDGDPVQTGTVVLVSFRHLARLDGHAYVSMLSDADRRAGGG